MCWYTRRKQPSTSQRKTAPTQQTSKATKAAKHEIQPRTRPNLNTACIRTGRPNRRTDTRPHHLLAHPANMHLHSRTLPRGFLAQETTRLRGTASHERIHPLPELSHSRAVLSTRCCRRKDGRSCAMARPGCNQVAVLVPLRHRCIVRPAPSCVWWLSCGLVPVPCVSCWSWLVGCPERTDCYGYA